MKVRIVAVLLLASVPVAAQAIPEGPSSQAQLTTETWLQLQPRGVHASDKRQDTTPREYDKSMERWLKVYDYKIPEHFKWEKVNSEGRGGGS